MNRRNDNTSALARSDSASSKKTAEPAAVEGCVASAKAPCYRCSSCLFAVPAVLLQVMVLAWPGVVVQFLLIGLCAKYVFPYNWTWPESFLFGAMMAATDPVAVVAVLQEVCAGAGLPVSQQSVPCLLQILVAARRPLSSCQARYCQQLSCWPVVARVTAPCDDSCHTMCVMTARLCCWPAGWCVAEAGMRD